MQEVADAAGVSKGLIHYHFRDKETLLARLVEHLAEGIIAREHAAAAALRTPAAVDTLWQWLEAELARGHVRALLALALDPSEGVHAAARAAAKARRDTAAETVTTLFAALELTPRVPPAMLAEVAVAFADGLALDAAMMPETERRVAFDVFWLALLSLAE
jgi:AcrR family transcriptional regulator